MHLPSKFLSGNNMKYLKLAIISFAFLFGLVTLISLLFPSTIYVSRAIDIKGSQDSAYYRISNTNEWKKWVANADTLPVEASNNRTFKMGDTKAFITSVSATQVKTDWQVKEGKKLPGTFNIIRHKDNPVITVQWQFVQKLKWYPWEKFASIVTDKVLGPFMEQSLDNLKKSIENTQ